MKLGLHHTEESEHDFSYRLQVAQTGQEHSISRRTGVSNGISIEDSLPHGLTKTYPLKLKRGTAEHRARTWQSIHLPLRKRLTTVFQLQSPSLVKVECWLAPLPNILNMTLFLELDDHLKS